MNNVLTHKTKKKKWENIMRVFTLKYKMARLKFVVYCLFVVLDQDIIAYNVPNGTTGNHVHSGPIGMDFKVMF
jgi:hypothetical protein